jgi:hypothetical protein
MPHLLFAQRSKHAAVFQGAIDVVFGNALADDAAAFKCHVAQQAAWLPPTLRSITSMSRL